jgi:hypothetical protein
MEGVFFHSHTHKYRTKTRGRNTTRKAKKICEKEISLSPGPEARAQVRRRAKQTPLSPRNPALGPPRACGAGPGLSALAWGRPRAPSKQGGTAARLARGRAAKAGPVLLFYKCGWCVNGMGEWWCGGFG